MSKKIKLNCENCGIEYETYASRVASSKYCSKACRDEHKTIYNKVVKCLTCETEFVSKRGKKYCKRECYIGKVKLERVTLKCNSCGKDYERPKHKPTKYCSKACRLHAQSSGLEEIPSSGRMGFRKDLNPNNFFKSSLEADYARWCEATNKPYIYEHKTFTVKYGDKDKKYTPDFYHPDEDRYVELKAVRRDKKYNTNLLAADILKNDGLNIDVLLMNEFYKQIKQSGQYWTIDNIENKNYLGTRHLIYLKALKSK